jgi:NADH:ubiquinone oxidoreductase subunit 6 (subunit J)
LTPSFLSVRALAVGASLLVIGQRNPIYSVLLLIASFAAVGRPLRAARRALRGRSRR